LLEVNMDTFSCKQYSKMNEGRYKNMHFHTPKKILFSIFTITLILSAFVFTNFGTKTQTANAQVIDVPVGGLLLTAITAHEAAQTQKELSLDSLANAAAKVMLRSVTNSVVTWINSGFQGSPAFVTNPERFFLESGDKIVGEFLTGTELDYLCGPFAEDIRFKLQTVYGSTLPDHNQCRLTGILAEADKYEQYVGGDFSKGGWQSWISVSQNPQNNPLEAFVAAKNELENRLSDNKENRLNEINWGDGFLPYRECKTLNDNGTCKEYGDIKTPGKIIEEQLNETLGSGGRQLEVADELNEIINALVGQLVQTVFVDGLTSFGPGGSNNNILETPLSITCTPSKTTATVEENIRWTASVFGGTGATTFSWSGTDGLSGNTSSVNIIYGTQGTKTGTVTVTKGNETVTQDCLSSVSIPTGPLPPPLDVLCSPDKTNAQIGESVTWTANVVSVSSDSGPTTYNWSGSDPINGSTLQQVTLAYSDPGTKTASVMITRNGQTVSRACSQQVEIPVPPLSATCAPNVTTARVGETVLWTTTVAGLNASQTQPTYSWSGTSPIGGLTTQVASVVYPSTGTKTANVRVSRYGQTVTPRCSPNVRIIP
jgi:hypothetical protein